MNFNFPQMTKLHIFVVGNEVITFFVGKKVITLLLVKSDHIIASNQRWNFEMPAPPRDCEVLLEGGTY